MTPTPHEAIRLSDRAPWDGSTRPRRDRSAPEVNTQTRDARAALNQMALRRNDWTLGAFCARYCGVVAQHDSVEEASVFHTWRAANRSSNR